MKTKKEGKIRFVPFKEFWMKQFKDIEYAREFLKNILEDEDFKLFMVALRQVVEAQGGIGKLAEKTRLNKNTLYKTLSESGNPEAMTLIRILAVYGLKLSLYFPLENSKKLAYA